MRKRLSLILLVPTVLCAADFIGLQAEQRYHGMMTPERGPLCTGACLPQSCEPTCITSREENELVCSKIEHLRTHKVEYECTRH